MDLQDCDLSPMKLKVEQELKELIGDMERSLAQMADDNQCVLGNLDQIRRRLAGIEATSASFYLYCYLAPYTDKYLDLSQTIQRLSQRRHGALVVIERTDPLDSWMQRGTMIDAAVSSTLLESIFYPGSPLHDGAVLIRANSIVSAGNVLPLSGSSLVDPNLGTRHRAALGLTEKSDALVLIVSEETGQARFAYKGRLYPLPSV
ncbi:sporulation-specific diadenylate cyclase CdaS [Brevibacillus composti]|uniref:Diadenylate cyclase n=1 Tax=Brevibacillus composti TaxID=2796470 RepID=A0A7T5JPC9_9BACL|nr:sporulation-specific diadenylate cyclase CdaS [Brevibacillus composti]QQE75343.1 DNA integrity scanning protein DisA nucleotide-binding domain protein [Brevibacillus composti]QUO42369.1 sporulation-specific diadenylate cyclase CdaS [Brevibacillus composti]